MKTRAYLTIMMAFVFCVTVHQGLASADTPFSVSINNSKIAMGAAYNGTDIFVSGTIPKDTEILIRVLGKKADQHFKEKGKALGVLWMNMKTVEMHDVPNIMMLGMSESLAQWMDSRPDAWRQLGLGFDALRQEIGMRADEADKDMLFQELLELKRKEGLYNIQKAAVHYTEEGQGKEFQATMQFPSALAEGTYTLETIAVRDGAVVARENHEITAEMTGIPAFLAKMAWGHSLLYGVLAVLVAIFSGVLMGYMFRGEQGAH